MKATIQYKGDLSPEQLDALNAQLRRDERDIPLVFKGRQGIIDHIAALMADLKGLAKSTSKSYTQVIHGPPGSGKSTLLHELKIQNSTEDSNVKVVTVGGKDLVSKDEFITAVLDEFEVGTDDLTVKKTPKKGSSLSVLGVDKGELAVETEYGAQADRMNLSSTWRLLEQFLKEDEVLLLCVDEAQTISGYTEVGVHPLLIDFHMGRTGNLRVLPIFAGLNDTTNILANQGMSRLSTSSIFRLSSLSMHEAEDVVLDTLAHSSFGLEGFFTEEDKKLLAKSLAIASDRWPRHLHYYIQGLLRQIAEDQERDSPTYYIESDRVLEYGHKARLDYYYQRAILVDRSFLQSLMKSLKDDRSSLRAAELERICCDEFSMTHNQFKQALEQAVHVGLIELEGLSDATVQIPIPSLRTFLVCQGDRERTRAFLRKDHERQLEHELNL